MRSTVLFRFANAVLYNRPSIPRECAYASVVLWRDLTVLHHLLNGYDHIWL